tara:strand:+ start:172 stop:627 length:456 start_codon:yes stop_codon:yes gene_type:complete
MPQNGGGRGWMTDPDSGEKVMPQQWSKFLDWLLLGPERQPRLQKDWAAENGVHEDSVRRWKRDPRFRKEWESRAAELNIHVERIQGVVDAVHAQAVQGDMKAASLYLQYVQALVPTKRVIVDKADASALSDAELASELEEMLAGLKGGEVA